MGPLTKPGTASVLLLRVLGPNLSRDGRAQPAVAINAENAYGRDGDASMGLLEGVPPGLDGLVPPLSSRRMGHGNAEHEVHTLDHDDEQCGAGGDHAKVLGGDFDFLPIDGDGL